MNQIEKTLLRSLTRKFKGTTFQSVYVHKDQDTTLIAIDFNTSTTMSLECNDGLLEIFMVRGDDFIPNNISGIAKYANDYLFKLGQESYEKQINYWKKKKE